MNEEYNKENRHSYCEEIEQQCDYVDLRKVDIILRYVKVFWIPEIEVIGTRSPTRREHLDDRNDAADRLEVRRKRSVDTNPHKRNYG